MGLREAPEHQRSARIRVQRKTIHRASFTMYPIKISVCLSSSKIACLCRRPAAGHQFFLSDFSDLFDICPTGHFIFLRPNGYE